MIDLYDFCNKFNNKEKFEKSWFEMGRIRKIATDYPRYLPPYLEPTGRYIADYLGQLDTVHSR